MKCKDCHHASWEWTDIDGRTLTHGHTTTGGADVMHGVCREKNATVCEDSEACEKFSHKNQLELFKEVI